MAYTIMSQNGNTQYGVTEYVVDQASDIASLPTDIAPGSVAIVTANSDVYMLNNSETWVKL